MNDTTPKTKTAVVHIALDDFYAEDIEQIVQFWKDEGEDEVSARSLAAGEALVLHRPDVTVTFWLHGGEKSMAHEEELRCVTGRVVGIEGMDTHEASAREAQT